MKIHKILPLAILVPVAVLAVLPARAQAPPRAVVRTPQARALAARLAPLLDGPPFDHAEWGIAILDPRGRLAYERNADRLFVPASAGKLLVAATAAALLPADFAYRTSLYTADTVVDGVLRGDLVLYGRGDPTLSARWYPTDLAAFELLADSLRARGITRIAGDVVGDASYFDSLALHPSWETYDLMWWYAAPVTALGFGENTIDVGIAPSAIGLPPAVTLGRDFGMVRFRNFARTVPPGAPRTFDFYRTPGTNDIWAAGDLPADARPWTDNIAIVHAPLFAATAFDSALASRGIAVEGRARATFDPGASAAARERPPLAELTSPPLEEILKPILQLSHNWYAELLLRTLGRELAGSGSYAAGLAVERRFLADSLGVDSEEVQMVDASGLSHHDLVAPRAFVTLMRAMREREGSERFLDALAEPGGQGTLETRFRAARLHGRVRAKTGSIANTNALIGYLTLRDGSYWTYAIMLNNHAIGTRDALRRIDAIVGAIR